MQQSVVQDEVAVPWDLLDTAVLRSELLVKPETFSHVKTLDPMRMAPREVYDILDLLLKGQTSGLRPLEFSIRDNSNSNAILQDDDVMYRYIWSRCLATAPTEYSAYSVRNNFYYVLIPLSPL